MYVYGKNVVKEVLKTKKVKKVFMSNNFKDIDIINEIERKNLNIKYLDKKGLDSIQKTNHQGIILEIEDYKYTDISKLEGNIVILDHLEDPHNFGAIIRTCEAAGITSIIIPKDRSIEVNSTVIKVSTGTIEKVKIARETNLTNAIKYLKNNGYWIIGTDMNGDNYKEIDYKGKIAIVIGNEGKGMSKLVKDNCDFIATIPMKGTVNSLNASVAAGIIIFEATNE